ncbi:hypothetical protein [Luteibacter aegosomatissinici]|uniref:hypothetical protein n=1 Tax=Luteibacter aegosomatissinici TaxID=2911539 RepID=UPI001FF8690F|nr:hypothetical protein [Luteibacter aegosomatissinici]UPG94942.1 hypothetical protein L2Y97_02205 [Luteibacter aegosomatissinici]
MSQFPPRVLMQRASVIVLALAAQAAHAELDVQAVPTDEPATVVVNTLASSVDAEIALFTDRRDLLKGTDNELSSQKTRDYIAKGRRATYATAEYRTLEAGKSVTYTIFARSGADDAPWDPKNYVGSDRKIIARASHGEFIHQVHHSPGLDKAVVDAELKVARTIDYLKTTAKVPSAGDVYMWVSQAPCASCNTILKQLDTRVIPGNRILVRYLPANAKRDLGAPSAQFNLKRNRALEAIGKPGSSLERHPSPGGRSCL